MGTRLLQSIPTKLPTHNIETSSYKRHWSTRELNSTSKMTKKIMKIIQAAHKADGKNPPKQLVTKAGRYGAPNSRTSLVMIDVVLYAGEYGKNNHKPVLPQAMVQQEKLRSHMDTGCGGSEITCKHIRRRYHHSRATSTRSLESMTSILIPCFRFLVQQKMHLSRGFLPYAETRNIMMTVAGYQCSDWSHDMLHMIYEEEL